MISSTLLTQAIVPSSLVVLPSSLWRRLHTELVATVHVADRWTPVDWDKPLPVAEARSLIRFASRTGVGEQRLALIPWADQMGAETGNSLLKLLEEPPSGLHIVLLAETKRLLPTVLSRVTVLSPLSATIEGKSGEGEAWQQAAKRLDTKHPEGRKEASRLLYLHALTHHGIKPETILETVRPS